MPTISSKTQLVYRRMRFIPKPPKEYASAHYSGNKVLEDYIFNTKDEKLPNICAMHNDNLTTGQRKAINRLQRSHNTITVKPADKNLGVVIMDTDDYITHCLALLMNQSIYRLAVLSTCSNKNTN